MVLDSIDNDRRVLDGMGIRKKKEKIISYSKRGDHGTN